MKDIHEAYQMVSKVEKNRNKTKTRKLEMKSNRAQILKFMVLKQSSYSYQLFLFFSFPFHNLLQTSFFSSYLLVFKTQATDF